MMMIGLEQGAATDEPLSSRMRNQACQYGNEDKMRSAFDIIYHGRTSYNLQNFRIEVFLFVHESGVAVAAAKRWRYKEAAQHEMR
jgi:hypothetical protein